jgi:hypothetical protein
MSFSSATEMSMMRAAIMSSSRARFAGVMIVRRAAVVDALQGTLARRKREFRGLLLRRTELRG